MATDRLRPIFVISMAAELAEMHPQTLRQYDRLGLVSPSRQGGKQRRYSEHDVELLREIQRLSKDGVSLEGIRRIMALENQVAALRSRVGELSNEVFALRSAHQAMGLGRVLPPAAPAMWCLWPADSARAAVARPWWCGSRVTSSSAHRRQGIRP